MPSVGRALQNCSIVDFVWDEYRSYSLKAMTEAESGNGVREFVGPFATIPKNLNEFLCDSQDKTELFKFLSKQVCGMHIIHGSKAVYTTCGTSVINVGGGCSNDELHS